MPEPYFADPWLTVYGGDARAVLASLPAESVHVCITSPPYYGLRSYGTPAQVWGGDPDHEHAFGTTTGYVGHRGNRGQVPQTKWPTQPQYPQASHGPAQGFCECGAWCGHLGLEPTPELYIAHLVEVGREIWRVLRPDGIFWLNLGDSYAAASTYSAPRSMHTEAGWKQDGRRPAAHRPPGCKPKDLIGIPWMAAFALRADGWWLRKNVIWAKPNGMPESVDDRPSSAHEDIFMLTRSGETLYWTHRDGQPGTRTEPPPDFRWIDRASDAETADEPPDWRTATLADGTRRWRRVNLWSGHDYFYDGIAVREPFTSSPSDLRKMAEGKARLGGKTVVDPDPMHSANAANNIGRKRGVGDAAAAAAALKQDAGAQIRGGDRMTGFNARWDEAAAEGTLPGGRTLRDVWTIATEPYPGAHYAVFPKKLVTKPILASTSERGVCPTCGAPWERLTRASGGTIGASWNDHEDDLARGNRTSGVTKDGTYTRIETGWSRTCAHDEAPVPATVLDPFAGSGTVGLVAQRLSRRAVLVDLHPDYLVQQMDRNHQPPLGLTGE